VAGVSDLPYLEIIQENDPPAISNSKAYL